MLLYPETDRPDPEAAYDRIPMGIPKGIKKPKRCTTLLTSFRHRLHTCRKGGVMSVFFERGSKTFHLRNRWISYVMKILPNDQLGHLYFGKAVSRKGSYDYLIEPSCRPMSSYVFEGEYTFSLEHTRQEYPSYGTGDFRDPAIGIRLTNGSTVSDFHFERYEVKSGKPGLEGLPATYCEDEGSAYIRIS